MEMTFDFNNVLCMYGKKNHAFSELSQKQQKRFNKTALPLGIS